MTDKQDMVAVEQRHRDAAYAAVCQHYGYPETADCVSRECAEVHIGALAAARFERNHLTRPAVSDDVREACSDRIFEAAMDNMEAIWRQNGLLGADMPEWREVKDTAPESYEMMRQAMHEAIRLTLLNQPAPGREGWLPIESAPTDWSRDVDLWVVWQGHAERITDCRASLANGKPAWKMRCDEYGWRDVHGVATHWRERPAAPQPEQVS